MGHLVGQLGMDPSQRSKQDLVFIMVHLLRISVDRNQRTTTTWATHGNGPLSASSCSIWSLYKYHQRVINFLRRLFLANKIHHHLHLDCWCMSSRTRQEKHQQQQRNIINRGCLWASCVHSSPHHIQNSDFDSGPGEKHSFENTWHSSTLMGDKISFWPSLRINWFKCYSLLLCWTRGPTLIIPFI